MSPALAATPKSGFSGRRPFRIFISYSHEDRELIAKIAALLTANGLQPMWDKNFAYGAGFQEQIRKFIAHAHVFLPVITPTSNARNWVHQEIGYAMALNIPVIPLAVGQLPGEMIQQIHAICLLPDKLELLHEKLSLASVDALIKRHSGPKEALYTCAETPDLRAEMLAGYAEDVLDLGEYDVVRQKGGLSSFHIPTETIGHPIWKLRYGIMERSEDHCRYQRRERLALGCHADRKGCRLIVNPWLQYERYGIPAAICRLRQLREFLEAAPDELCQVTFKRDMQHAESVTILGNWFAAESVSAEVGKGYRQTIFTRHAPTVMAKLDNFDAEFAELLPSGVDACDSRRWAIVELGKCIDELASKKTT
jgi:hypothetical protein